MFLSLMMDKLEYTYSKNYAFKWVGIWLVLLIGFLIKLMFNFQQFDWWLNQYILLLAINLLVVIKRHLVPALAAKIAIEISDDYIINRGEKIEFTAIDHFVLYNSGVIAVILNEACKRPKNALKWLGYRLNILFYRSYVIIDTRDVKVNSPVLFNILIDRLNNPKLNASL